MKSRTPLLFETSEAAKDAGWAFINKRLYGGIQADRKFEQGKAASGLAAEVANWKASKAEERRQVQKAVMRRPGKRVILIERRAVR
ncbi:hypothetical protein DYI37_03220 [Fulvimarina endophytica]|uniref:Uncharacterized protein n=1 Tax=Fulvimarina endophytica TaxID=2293836 RepID=A0A371XB44_9HYPH|nr:hypothetical protein [Fulvimarina endophytica]RFC66466.1 hypothetical protein DYI37_03220 [Fulvimarina endophytica]